MYHKFFLVMAISLFSQIASAQTFEVVAGNVSEYQIGTQLELSNVELRAGQHLTLKAVNSSRQFYLNGPYTESPDKKGRLTRALVRLLITTEECDCDPKTFSCTIKCTRAPEEKNLAETITKTLWQLFRQQFFNQAAPSSAPPTADEIEHLDLPTDPWVLVAPLDEHFCHQPNNKKIALWQPEFFKDKIWLKESTAEQLPTTDASELEQKWVTILHTMPDDEILPSNTHKAVWMVENDCLRQARLLFSPVAPSP